MATKMGHIPQNMLNMQTAQASKDATMAYFTQNFNQVICYFILGSYHSNYQQGIIWWVNKINLV
jgi:hypothetical protein